jgi:hypothetical protein
MKEQLQSKETKSICSTQMTESGDVLGQNGEFSIGEAGLKPLLRPRETLFVARH